MLTQFVYIQNKSNDINSNSNNRLEGIVMILKNISNIHVNVQLILIIIKDSIDVDI